MISRINARRYRRTAIDAVRRATWHVDRVTQLAGQLVRAAGSDAARATRGCGCYYGARQRQTGVGTSATCTDVPLPSGSDQSVSESWLATRIRLGAA